MSLFSPRHRRKALGSALVAGLLLLAGPQARAQALKPVTMRVDTFFYGAHVPILYGIVSGLYKKHGLEVTAQPGRGSATTIQTVAAGTDQFGFADGGVLVKFAAQGLQAKQVLGILQSSPAVILAMPDSGITKPKDLEGRKGGFGNGSAPEQIFAGFVKATGIDASKIQRVVVDLPTRDNLFLQKQTDFSFGFSVTQIALLESRCNCKLNVIRYSDHGLNPISNGIVVSSKYAADNPETVKAFVQATAEAINESIKSPDKAIDAFFAYAKETQLTRDIVTKQWAETTGLLHSRATAGKPVGIMDAGDWQKTIDLLVEYADLPKGSVKPEAVFTNEFLAK